MKAKQICIMIYMIAGSFAMWGNEKVSTDIDEILTQYSAFEISETYFKGKTTPFDDIELAELAYNIGRIDIALACIDRYLTQIENKGSLNTRLEIIRHKIANYFYDDYSSNIDENSPITHSMHTSDKLLLGIIAKSVNDDFPIIILEDLINNKNVVVDRKTDILDVLEILIECYAFRGELEKAHRTFLLYSDAVERSCAPGSIFNLKKNLLLSVLALKEGDYAMSSEFLNRASLHIMDYGTIFMPDEAVLLLRRADIGSATGRYRAVENFGGRVIGIYHQYPEAPNLKFIAELRIAESLVMAEKIAQAEYWIKSLIKNWPKGTRMLKDLIRLFICQSELFILQGFPKQSLQTYESAIYMYNHFKMSDIESGLRLQAGAGYACVQGDNEDKAIEYFREQLDKERALAHDEFVFMPEGKRGRYWAHADTRMCRLFSVNREGSLTLKGGKVVDMPSHNRNATSELLFDASLFYKGLLLESSAALRRALSGQGGTVSADVKRLDSLRDIIASRPNPDAALVASADELEKKLLQKVPELSGFMDFMSIDWRRIRASLKSDELAVEFVCSTDGGIDYYSAELLRRDWDKPKHVFLFSVKEGKSPFDAADVYENNTIYRRLWRKIEPYLSDGDRVYFAAAGCLHNTAIEYALLPDNTRFNDRYRAERVSSCRRIIHHRAAAGDMIATVYGGLNYNADPEESNFYATEAEERLFAMRGADFGGMADVSWSYLPGTRDEARSIEKAMKEAGYRVTLFEGDEGVEESFKKLSGLTPRLIHVATHGFFNPAPVQRRNIIASTYEEDDASLYRCGLVMSGANMPVSGGDDGILTAKEIAALDLYGTDLVVLSACGTGMGRISGDGVFGLQRAFKLAGVESVLMSLWPVHDEATAMFMNEFYKALTDGKDKRSALRAAQKALAQAQFTVEEGVLPGSDPRFWAAFILLD